jgi:hypothetical protein
MADASVEVLSTLHTPADAEALKVWSQPGFEGSCALMSVAPPEEDESAGGKGAGSELLQPPPADDLAAAVADSSSEVEAKGGEEEGMEDGEGAAAVAVEDAEFGGAGLAGAAEVAATPEGSGFRAAEWSKLPADDVELPQKPVHMPDALGKEVNEPERSWEAREEEMEVMGNGDEVLEEREGGITEQQAEGEQSGVEGSHEHGELPPAQGPEVIEPEALSASVAAVLDSAASDGTASPSIDAVGWQAGGAEAAAESGGVYVPQAEAATSPGVADLFLEAEAAKEMGSEAAEEEAAEEGAGVGGEQGSIEVEANATVEVGSKVGREDDEEEEDSLGVGGEMVEAEAVVEAEADIAVEQAGEVNPALLYIASEAAAAPEHSGNSLQSGCALEEETGPGGEARMGDSSLVDVAAPGEPKGAVCAPGMSNADACRKGARADTTPEVAAAAAIAADSLLTAAVRVEGSYEASCSADADIVHLNTGSEVEGYMAASPSNHTAADSPAAEHFSAAADESGAGGGEGEGEQLSSAASLEGSLLKAASGAVVAEGSRSAFALCAVDGCLPSGSDAAVEVPGGHEGEELAVAAELENREEGLECAGFWEEDEDKVTAQDGMVEQEGLKVEQNSKEVEELEQREGQTGEAEASLEDNYEQQQQQQKQEGADYSEGTHEQQDTEEGVRDEESEAAGGLREAGVEADEAADEVVPGGEQENSWKQQQQGGEVSGEASNNMLGEGALTDGGQGGVLGSGSACSSSGSKLGREGCILAGDEQLQQKEEKEAGEEEEAEEEEEKEEGQVERAAGNISLQGSESMLNSVESINSPAVNSNQQWQHVLHREDTEGQEDNLAQEQQQRESSCLGGGEASSAFAAAAEDLSEADLGIISDHGSDDDEASCDGMGVSVSEQELAASFNRGSSSSRSNSKHWDAQGVPPLTGHKHQDEQQEVHVEQQQHPWQSPGSELSSGSRDEASMRSSRMSGLGGGRTVPMPADAASHHAAGTASASLLSASSRNSRRVSDQSADVAQPPSRPSSAPCSQSSSSAVINATGANNVPVQPPSAFVPNPPWVPAGLCPATQEQLQGILAREAASWEGTRCIGQQQFGSRGSDAMSNAGEGGAAGGGGQGYRERKSSSSGSGVLGSKLRPGSAGSNSSTGSSKHNGIVERVHTRSDGGVGGAARVPRPPTAPARTTWGNPHRDVHYHEQQQQQVLHTVHEVSPRSMAKSPQPCCSNRSYAPGALHASTGSSSSRRFANSCKNSPSGRPQTAPAGRVAARMGIGAGTSCAGGDVAGSAVGGVGSGRSPFGSPLPDWDGHLKPVMGWEVIDPRGPGSSSGSRPGTSYSSSSNYSYYHTGSGSGGGLSNRPNSADSYSRSKSSYRPGTSGGMARGGLGTYMADIVQKVRQANCYCQQLGLSQHYSLHAVGGGREQLRVLVENLALGDGCSDGGGCSSSESCRPIRGAVAEAQQQHQEQEEEDGAQEGVSPSMRCKGPSECCPRSPGVGRVGAGGGAGDGARGGMGSGGSGASGGGSPTGQKTLLLLGTFLHRHEQLREKACHVQQRRQQQQQQYDWQEQEGVAPQQYQEDVREAEEEWMQEEEDGESADGSAPRQCPTADARAAIRGKSAVPGRGAGRCRPGIYGGQGSYRCSADSSKAEIWSADDDGASSVVQPLGCDRHEQEQQQQQRDFLPSGGNQLQHRRSLASVACSGGAQGGEVRGCLAEAGSDHDSGDGLVHVQGVAYGVPAWIAEQLPAPARPKHLLP